jgi:pyridoxal 5'-phosphate synthase pdxS subunit
VLACTHYDDPELLAQVSEDLGEPMTGVEIEKIPQEELMQYR